MIRRHLDRIMCRLGCHLWTHAFVGQFPTLRVVSRYCTRCDATRHVTVDIWDTPTRAFTLAAYDELDLRQGGAA